MGCDIHTQAIDADGSVMRSGEWAYGNQPFGSRHYGAFAFLAGIRNYSGITPISEPRGIPDNFKGADEWDGLHSHSWLSVAELSAFDYDAIVIDRRARKHVFSDDGTYMGSSVTTLPENVGEWTTWREFLGQCFMDDIEELKRLAADRVVFAFDS